MLPAQGKKGHQQLPHDIIRRSSDMKSKLEDVILGSSGARSHMMRRKQFAQISGKRAWAIHRANQCVGGYVKVHYM